MKNNHEYFDFYQAKLDEQLEQLEQSAHLAGNQPAARTYTSLQTLYAPASRHEEQALERVYQRLAKRTATNAAQFHELAAGMVPPITEQATMPLRLLNRRVQRKRVWLRTLAAVLIVGLLVSGFLELMSLHSQSTQLLKPIPSLSKIGAWHIVPTPNISNSSTSLVAVTALSDYDAWAVGSFSPLSSVALVTPLILHWNGEVWKSVPTANTAQQGELTAVAALSANDVWAIGNGNASNQVSRPAQPFIEHWNGQQWRAIPNPHPNQAYSLLSGIVALASNDIWAVGSYFNLSGSYSVKHVLMEHWDGSRWSLVPTPTLGTTQQLAKFAALSPTDIWAVGSFTLTTNPNAPRRTLIEHWNGSTWQVIPSPAPVASSLSDISASSPTDVWAVGAFRSDDAFPARTLVEHWNGKGWAVVSSPNPALTANDSLLATVALASNDVWASGLETGSQLLHWDGKQWQIVRAAYPTENEDGPTFLSFARDPSSPGVLWMVGSDSTPGSVRQMLIETNRL